MCRSRADYPINEYLKTEIIKSTLSYWIYYFQQIPWYLSLSIPIYFFIQNSPIEQIPLFYDQDEIKYFVDDLWHSCYSLYLEKTNTLISFIRLYKVLIQIFKSYLSWILLLMIVFLFLYQIG